MATPTQIVTRNAQNYLGDVHDVVLALRVEWGTEAVTAAKNQGAALFVHLWTPFVLPVLSWVRARSIKRRMRQDPAAGVGILTLTAADQHILLSAMPSRRKTPTGIVRTLPTAEPLVADVELMEMDVVPLMTLGDYDLVADRVDFKALLAAVEAGQIAAPDLEVNLDRFKAVGQTRYG